MGIQNNSVPSFPWLCCCLLGHQYLDILLSTASGAFGSIAGQVIGVHEGALTGRPNVSLRLQCIGGVQAGDGDIQIKTPKGLEHELRPAAAAE